MAVGLAGLTCCDCCSFAAAVAMAVGFEAAATADVVAAVPTALGFAAAAFAAAAGAGAGAGVGVRIGAVDAGGKNSTKSVGKKPVLPLLVPLVHPPGSPCTRPKFRTQIPSQSTTHATRSKRVNRAHIP